MVESTAHDTNVDYIYGNGPHLLQHYCYEIEVLPSKAVGLSK